MGAQYIAGFQELGLDIDTLLKIQLRSNHFPPVHLDFIPACKEAITACNESDYDKEITMPNGITKTSGYIVEGLHLETFINQEGV